MRPRGNSINGHATERPNVALISRIQENTAKINKWTPTPTRISM